MTRTAPWLIGIGLFGYPIWASATAIAAPAAGSLGGIAHRAVVVLLALSVFVAVWRGTIRPVGTDFWWVIALLFVAMSLRLIREYLHGSPFPLQADPVRVILLFFGALVVPFFAFASAPSADPEGIVSRRVTSIVVSSATLIASLAGLALARGYQAVVNQRASTENINPISLGHLGVSCFLVCLLGCSGRTFATLARLCMMPIALALVIASGSRGPILALLLALTLYAARFLYLRRRIWSPVWPILLSALAATPVILDYALSMDTPLTRRIALSNLINAQPTGRSNVLPASIQEFWKSPILGTGLSEPITYQYPHNSIIEAFMSMGILGGSLFLFVLCYGLYRAFLHAFSTSSWCWAGFLFFQYVVYGMLSSSIYLLEVFWFLLAIVVAAPIVDSQHRVLQQPTKPAEPGISKE